MTLPQTMTAIAVERGQGPVQLVPAKLAVPQPGAGQILIKVAAAGVNHADLLQAEGRYPPPPGASDILGLEVSGSVAALGQGVTGLAVGEAVCALLPGGGYAEYAIASQLCVLPIPQGVSLKDAAGLPEVYFTVWTNVFDAAGLAPGESFLVHGGSSGIGTAAIQLMHARGHSVFTTAGSAEKCAACLKLGASLAVDYRKEDFVEAVRTATKGRGVDVILDMVGGDYIGRNLQALARNGRLVNISYLKGSRAEVDFRAMQQRHLSMTATGLRPRPDEAKGHIRDALAKEVWPLLDAGRIRPIIDRSFPLAEAGAAHRAMHESRHIGKILLEM